MSNLPDMHLAVKSGLFIEDMLVTRNRCWNFRTIYGG